MFLGPESSRQTASPQMPRPLKSRAMGMISGVAINLKSKLSHFNSNSEVNTSAGPSPQRVPPQDFRRSPPNHGEQPPSVIPLTVPGADASMPSFPYSKYLVLLTFKTRHIGAKANFLSRNCQEFDV